MRPTADAFVSEVYRSRNFGHSPALKVDSSPKLRTYVMFNVDLRSEDVQQVSLLLYGHTRSRAGFQVRLIGERWRERRITFANAPSLPTAFVASGPVQARAWNAVDVTPLLSGYERYVSFAVTTNSPKGAEFGSRETGLHGPRLVIEHPGNDTTGSTGTSTGAIP